MNPKLTCNQKFMLTSALDNGSRLSSGRYGFNDAHVRSLVKKDLAVLVKTSTWDKDYKLTDLGRQVATNLKLS